MLTVIPNADGNVTIQSALQSVIQYANVQNAKFNVKRLNVQNVLFTVTNLNVMFVVLKICVRRRVARNVRQFVRPPTAEHPVLHLIQYVHQCARKPNVTGSAKNHPPVLNPNVNYNANVQPVKLLHQLHSPRLLVLQHAANVHRQM